MRNDDGYFPLASFFFPRHWSRTFAYKMRVAVGATATQPDPYFGGRREMALNQLPLLLVLFAVGAWAQGPSPSPAPLPFTDQVTIESGDLQGILNATGRYFLGIPYAAPPVGQFRWTAPRPVLPWTEPLNVSQFGPGCIQDCTLPPLTCPQTISEDCLILDVYTPVHPPGHDLGYPVMVFFPGGEFLQGGASTVLYDGTSIGNQTNTIVVVINFRLGALGFLANDNFDGNYGFLDQQWALQWVQRNIAAFAGNPSSVTIFGQSAGATSTTAHLISPQSKDLFHQAIVESNPVALNLNTMEEQQTFSSIFTQLVGCDSENSHEQTSCLLNLTADEITAGQAELMIKGIPKNAPINIFYPWTPTIDGYLVPGQPINLFPKGYFNQVPMMIGTVHDEGWLFIWEVQPIPIPSPEYVALLGVLFGENAGAVLDLYPVSPLEKDTRPQLNNVITDYLFTCPTRWLIQSALRSGSVAPIYNYQFNHVMSYYDAWGPDYEFCWYDYVCHASELPFVFGSPQIAGFTPTAEENVLSSDMVKFWGNFAHSGNPNTGPGTVDGYSWPQYDLDQQLSADLNLTLGLIPELRKEYCDYWDSVGYFQP